MNLKGILWASFFINAASFFFTLRPRVALALLLPFFAVAVLGNYLMAIEFFSQPVEFCLVILFLFLPVILNAIFISLHESKLNHATSNAAEKAYDLVSNIGDLVK